MNDKVLSDYVQVWDEILYSFYNVVASIRYLTQKRRVKDIIKRNLLLKNIHKGERCFLILNGPSVDDNDLSCLEREYVICCNYFYRSTVADVVKPNYICWLDSKDIASEIGNVIINEIQTKYPESKLIFNIKALNVENEKNRNLFFTYNKHLPYEGHIKIDLDKMCSGFKSVAFYAIITAIYMGFSEIIILGMDFEPTGFSHFEHVAGEMKKLNTQNNRHEICDHYWGYAQQHREAYAISDYAKRNGVRIVNLNSNSFIRAFEFGGLEDVIKT